MSQSYETIAGTETAAQAKAKINNTSGALRSNHSGPNEPTDKTAYMFWFDTTLNLLKLRNTANDAWVTVGELDDTNSDFHPIIQNWAITHSGDDLLFKYNGTNTMKLTSTGDLTVIGDITAFGSI
tara:strand:- start:1128 stop:1502 length:375 start_codon:yes stop_codon:yes gene_type:complete